MKTWLNKQHGCVLIQRQQVVTSLTDVSTRFLPSLGTEHRFRSTYDRLLLAVILCTLRSHGDGILWFGSSSIKYAKTLSY